MNTPQERAPEVAEDARVERFARAICLAAGRHCHEMHPCDRNPCKCHFWYLHKDEARAAIEVAEDGERSPEPTALERANEAVIGTVLKHDHEDENYLIPVPLMHDIRDAVVAAITAAETAACTEMAQRLRDCAMYDALMEGPRFKNWNLTRLNRFREECEALLADQPPSSRTGTPDAAAIRRAAEAIYQRRRAIIVGHDARAMWPENFSDLPNLDQRRFEKDAAAALASLADHPPSGQSDGCRSDMEAAPKDGTRETGK